MSQRPRIVFMGTPDFAVPALRALFAQPGFDIVAVCCQPDRPQGRGKKLQPCPVKTVAQELGLPVLQFERLRAPEGVEALTALTPDFFVTAAFGQILSQKLLNIPRLGTVNLHASLLPAYRGPAPINWCLIEGQEVTGCTTMMTDAGIDTGDILLQRTLEILPGERAGSLSGRLSEIGAPLLVETLKALLDGTCPRIPQDHDRATRHPMLIKELGRIDWHLPAGQIINLMRGLDPWPGIYTTLEGEITLKIHDAQALALPARGRPGTVLLSDARQGLYISTGEGVLSVLSLQAPGTKRLDTPDFLRGRPIAVGTILGGEELNG